MNNIKQILFILLLILSASSLNAAVSSEWKEANEAYAKGIYAESIRLYEQLLQTQGESPELYYNLGNAYFKSNEIAKSILNYERALDLYPLYEDASVNLEMANQKIVDNLEDAETFFIRKWYEILVKLLPSNQWVVISVVFFLITLVMSFFFLFSNSMLIRKTGFYSGLIALILSITAFVFAGIRKNQEVNRQNAIIMSGVVVVKSSPDKSGTDLFQLHEGTKVKITGELGEWVEIHLINGNVGWMETKHLEKI